MRLTSEGGQTAALTRSGFCAAFLGPIVEKNANGAQIAMQRLLARSTAHRVVADIFLEHTESRQLFENLGFQTDRCLIRMSLRKCSSAGSSYQALSADGFEWD
jgi:hypothetical protein